MDHQAVLHPSQVNHQVLLNTDYEARNSTIAALEPKHHVQAPDGEQATSKAGLEWHVLSTSMDTMVVTAMDMFRAKLRVGRTDLIIL